MGSIHAKLLEIQRELKVEKAKRNDFGKYNYRSKEDILEAVKPLAFERGCTVVCDDDILCLPNGWVYVVTTATLTDSETGESVSAKGDSREPESRKGMDSSQITGSTSSYAGKRALGNLFAIDDTKDSDAMPNVAGHAAKPIPPGQSFTAACTVCGNRLDFQPGWQSIEQINEQAAANRWCCPAPSYEVV